MFKRGVGLPGKFCEGGVDSGSVPDHSRIYRCLKEGIFWEGGVDYGSVACGGEKGGIQLFWREG